MNDAGSMNRVLAGPVRMVLMFIASVPLLSYSGGCGFRKGTREATPDEACQRRLNDIGFAIGQYKQTHGRLPPPIVVGPNGMKHSWRAALMPYLMDGVRNADLVNYRMEESWDSPHNRDILPDDILRFTFACPAESRGGPWPFPYTSYLMLVRPSVAPSPSGGEVMDALPSDAVLIVESAGCGVKYFEPRDLPWEDLWEGDSPFGEGKLNSFHPRVVKAVRVDGKVIDIPRSISREELETLLRGTVTSHD